MRCKASIRFLPHGTGLALFIWKGPSWQSRLELTSFLTTLFASVTVFVGLIVVEAEPAHPATVNASDGWRRTRDGWEKAQDWAQHRTVQSRLPHPSLLAVLQGLVSVGVLFAATDVKPRGAELT